MPKGKYKRKPKLRLITRDKAKARILLRLLRGQLAVAKHKEQLAKMEVKNQQLFSLYMGFISQG
jgi:hypothetical protein